jgi:hypothetical protein
MRTSREWIERTVDELDDPTALAVVDGDVAPRPSSTGGGGLKIELTLSPEEADALDDICRADDLSPVRALTHIVRARLLGRPQFGRADRARLRSCLALLRALEQHVGRAARPATALRQTVAAVNMRTNELLDLGVYVRRVGRAIGESMLGNLQYWRGESGATPFKAAEPASRVTDPVRAPADAARERSDRSRARA